jgi:hypothetical protein
MTTTTTSARELARRENDGIEVVLLWEKVGDRLTVRVTDERTGDFFEFEAARDRAMHVFHHPYAYAAMLGVEYGSADDLVAA